MFYHLCDLGSLPVHCIIASLDVVSLYSNIRVSDGADAVMELFEVEHTPCLCLNPTLTQQAGRPATTQPGYLSPRGV